MHAQPDQHRTMHSGKVSPVHLLRVPLGEPVSGGGLAEG